MTAQGGHQNKKRVIIAVAAIVLSLSLFTRYTEQLRTEIGHHKDGLLLAEKRLSEVQHNHAVSQSLLTGEVQSHTKTKERLQIVQNELEEAQKNVIHQPPELTQPTTECRFQSQELNYMDQELFSTLGGKWFYQGKTQAVSPAKRDTPTPCEIPKSAMGKQYKYVEIGADNGQKFSNTFFLDKQLGWEGICVEPRPAIFDELKENRPNCHNVNAVVSTSPGPFEFYQYDKSTWHRQMSGLKGSSGINRDFESAQRYAQKEKTTVESIQIESVTFTELFRQHDFKRIEFMSVDVEGAELEVLKAIDYDAVSIRFIVTEGRSPSVKQFLLGKGFEIRKPSDMKMTPPKNNHDTWFQNPNYV